MLNSKEKTIVCAEQSLRVLFRYTKMTICFGVHPELCMGLSLAVCSLTFSMPFDHKFRTTGFLDWRIWRRPCCEKNMTARKKATTVRFAC